MQERRLKDLIKKHSEFISYPISLWHEKTVEKVRGRPNPALRILGVVITMHDKRTALARDIRSQIQKVFGGKVFKTVITKSVRLEESPAYKESIFTFAPDSTGATEYYSLCEEVIDRA